VAIQVGELKIGETFLSEGYPGTVVAKGDRTVSVLWYGEITRLDRKEVVYCETI